jgi:hypothetical protein
MLSFFSPRKYGGKQIFCFGHNILTEGMFVTQLSGLTISVGYENFLFVGRFMSQKCER